MNNFAAHFRVSPERGEGGWWKLRWRIDVADADGKLRRAWMPRGERMSA